MPKLQINNSHIPIDPWISEDASSSKSDPHTYVAFELMNQIFAVDVTNVREVLDMQAISCLPNAPSDLLGMIDVRGEGIAVIDLPVRLGFIRRTVPEDGRIVVFELGGSAKKPLGVIADRVLGVVEISESDIEPTPDAMNSWKSDAMIGVARIDNQLVMMLTAGKLCETALKAPFDFE